MRNYLLLTLILCITSNIGIAQNKDKEYPKSMVSMSDYKTVLQVVDKLRPQRLISLDDFNMMKDQENTIILDARSQDKFDQRHVKGAINLPFTEFTQDALEAIILDRNMRVLIYCNNNFVGDQINLASKSFVPSKADLDYTGKKKKETLLALNIPTFINLVGYGYENVYELDQLVHINDRSIEFEGTAVIKIGYIDGVKVTRYD